MMSLRKGLVVLGAAMLLGCDVPTDAPMVEQRWIIPMNDASISVERFLPDGVNLAGDLFALSISPFAVEGVLGDICTSCVNGGGVPAFQASFSGSQSLPEDVSSVVVETGSVAVAVQNGFSFDPTAGGGSVVINVSDGPGGRVLGQATISSGMAPGATVARAVSLTGGSLGSELTVSAVVTSAGGQSGVVDTSSKLLMSVEVVSLSAGFVTVAVANRSVGTSPIELDLEDIDQTVTRRIQSGQLILDITNPFGVAMTLDLTITYPGGVISRTVEVERAAVSTVVLPYTGDELQAFMGNAGVILTAVGPVSGIAEDILLRTDESMTLDASLDLTLILG